MSEALEPHGLKSPATIRSTYGKDAVPTDNLIISDQLARIELLLTAILAKRWR
jgi:hypothetical protein